MTDDEAIEAGIRITGVERWRYLCSEANTLGSPNSRADCIRYMREIAESGSLPMADFDEIERQRIAWEALPESERKKGCCPS